MLSADEILNLKARINTELTRRSYNGSLTDYVDNDYDFLNIPEADNPIFLEQGQKISEQLLQINDIGNLHFHDMQAQDKIPNS